MTTTEPRQQVRDVPVGTLVIYAHADRHYKYGGDREYGLDSIEFGLLTATTTPVVRCNRIDVAPADTPIPASDDRVHAVKSARGAYPTWKGPWRLHIAGSPGGFFKTKREAMATGLRAVAIADWHTTPAPDVPDGEPGVGSDAS